jgi:hypothetical protein
MPSSGRTAGSVLSRAVLQLYLVWQSSLLLLCKWSQDMTCPLFVRQSLGCHCPSLSTHWLYNEGARLMAAPSSLCRLLRSRSTYIWGYPYQQSLLRWQVPPHCQHMGCTVLLSLVPGDHGRKGALTLTTRRLKAAQLWPSQPLTSGLGIGPYSASSCHPWGGRTSPLSPLSHSQIHKLSPCGWSARAWWAICSMAATDSCRDAPVN